MMIRFNNVLHRLSLLRLSAPASSLSLRHISSKYFIPSAETVHHQQQAQLKSFPTTTTTSSKAFSSSAVTTKAAPISSYSSVSSDRTPRSKHAVDNAAFHDYTITDLMRARVHMGHRTKLWNPRMAPFLLGHRNGMHIINLDKTIPLLRRALTATSLMAEHDCTFLWLGPRDVQKSRIVERNASKAGAYTIDGARWIGGTLTNPINSNQVQRFNYRVPDCLFVVDANRHMPALREAKVVGIPTIGIVDSDCDPSMLTYPIPGNDDNALAIFLYCSLMKHAVLDGRRRGRRLNRPSFKIPDFSEKKRSRFSFRQ